jgi:hypothetical protein
MAALAGTA